METAAIEGMSEQEFDALLDTVVEGEFEKLGPAAFLDAVWALEVQQAEEVIEVTAQVVGDQLRFEPCPELPVRQNEILLSGKRVVVKLRPAAEPALAL